MPLVSASVFYPGAIDGSVDIVGNKAGLFPKAAFVDSGPPEWVDTIASLPAPTKVTTKFAIDAAGNYYGGADASVGSGGFGDVVKDPNGAYGIVQKVFKKDDGNYYLLVQLTPTYPNPSGLGLPNEPAGSGVGAYSFDPPANMGVSSPGADLGAIEGGRSVSGITSLPYTPQGTPIEVECLARQCTVIRHLDGSLMVASGSGAATIITNNPPTARNYFMG